MRNFGLLLILLCGLVSVCGASDSVRQSASPAAATNPFSSDWDDASGIVRPAFSTANDRSDPDRHFDRDGELTCYTIHTYLVKRQSGDSDVIEPVGHSTCQRASRYGVKKVEEPRSAPSR
ncbi:MAG TPA: hypothetical protein VNZ03_09165 [Terriglobales bacterium]|nr:hypothetical protein [Terriglobales bacterium]